MTQLAERLSDLATTGTHAITFQDIGLPADTVRDQVPEVAAGPLAPLLAEAIVHAYDAADGARKQGAAAFPSGFARQSRVLALTSSLETLLGSPATAKALAKPLNGALLDGLTEHVEHGPLLAAARLEGAVGLAASDAVSPYQVWDILEELPADGPEDFLERLPRVLGVALDCWAQQEAHVWRHQPAEPEAGQEPAGAERSGIRGGGAHGRARGEGAMSVWRSIQHRQERNPGIFLQSRGGRGASVPGDGGPIQFGPCTSNRLP